MSDRTAFGPSGRRFDEDHLLDAARAVLHAVGYSAAQLTDIAQRAGTTRPTLYARLGSKEQIYRRVIKREADVFRAWIVEAYDQGADLSLTQLARMGMDPLFRLAAERSEGFGLLFLGDRTGDHPTSLRRQVLGAVTEQLACLIERRRESFGPALGPTAEALAAACVGVAIHVCEHAIDRGDDLEGARQLAARFVANAFHNLDFDALAD
ncbi:TetR/AcrR family transcriptional regulator [Streptomyces sp. NPDC019224]|uniref:TetR/AcrR family transcriptional regulator n=1 Tax=unclassified Streptomyces TaxID=2593676 RepID=UPI0033CA0F5D